MRFLLLAIAILLYPAISTQVQAQSQLAISVGNRGLSLGFQMSTYPRLVRIPGYPVYYDPRVDSNYFFYDGLYWVYLDDNWYSSTWYNGPWDLIPPNYVPLYVLRVPVRYYRRPPSYFRGWRSDAAPRWGDRWGRDWERQHRGWDHWDRRSAPRAAPLPSYQRNYGGSRYPRQLNQQRSIESRNYRYQPREAVSRRIQEQRRQAVESRNQTQRRQQQDGRQQDVQRQQQRARRQQEVEQQQQRNVRQQQSVQRQQQQKARRQQDVQQQQQQAQRARQQRVQLLQKARQQPQPARSAGNKGGKGQSDRNSKGRTDTKKNRKDAAKDGGGHP